jgi:hypothetical protein
VIADDLIGCVVVGTEGDDLYGIQGLVLQRGDGARFIAFPHSAYEDCEIVYEPEHLVRRRSNGYPAVGA